MDISLFSKYQVKVEVSKINPCFEIAKLFVVELNKQAGIPYITKEGKKGKSKKYNEIMVLKDMKKLKISNNVHAMNSFLFQCEKSEIGFRRYYSWKLK